MKTKLFLLLLFLGALLLLPVLTRAFVPVSVAPNFNFFFGLTVGAADLSKKLNAARVIFTKLDNLSNDD